VSDPEPSTLPSERSAERIDLAGNVAVLASGQSSNDPQRESLARRVADRVLAVGGRVINVFANRSIPEQLAEFDNIDPALVIAVGGDGTVSAAASIAVDRNATLLIVPAGTMNLVAKDLGLPLDHDTLLAGITRMTSTRIDVAEVNGHRFLHSALLGLVPDMSIIREEIRRSGSVVDRAEHLSEFLHTAFAGETFSVDMRAGNRSAKGETRSIVVSNNPISERGFFDHTRDALNSGRLGVYASVHSGPFASARLITTLGTGQLAEDPETLHTDCEAMTIEVDTDPVRVALDGEVRELRSPLRFISRHAALRVAVPASFRNGAPA